MSFQSPAEVAIQALSAMVKKMGRSLPTFQTLERAKFPGRVKAAPAVRVTLRRRPCPGVSQ